MEEKKKFKGLPNWLSITLLVIASLLVFFLVLTETSICCTSRGCANNNSHFFRDCVSENVNLKTKPVTELSMLGSHDALSNDISFSSSPNSSEENITNNFWARVFAKGIMVRYAKAQNNNAYEQLDAGVRYLDVRITYVNGVFYNSHGLISNTLKYNLSHILRWLNDNPGEFIIFHICKFYNSTSNWSELKDFMESVKYEDKSLFDYINYDTSITEFKELNYNNLTSNGTKAGVLIFTESQSDVMPLNQISSEKCYSSWNNKVTHEEMVSSMETKVDNGYLLGNDYLRINQAQQTPNFNQLWDVFVGWSLLHLAEVHNAKMINEPRLDYYLGGLPIYMCDYTTSNDTGFNTNIINKLKTRNLSI